MKTIIATTDYSSDATNAVYYAAKLAATFNAKLVLFNAFELSVHTANAYVSPAAVNRMIKNNKERLADLAKEISETYGVEVESEAYMALIEDELENLVNKYQAALVVMGIQNELTENRLFGNTTTDVIRNAKFPVLVVPFGAYYSNVEKILFARDEKALREDDQNIHLLRELANGFDADIEVYHVEKMPVKPSEEHSMDVREDELEQLLDGTSHSYKMTNATKVADCIADEMKAYQPDMLVMIPRKGTFMDRLLKRSITRKMVMDTHVPLLALPDVSKKEEISTV